MGKTMKQSKKKAARDQAFRDGIAKRNPKEKRAYPAGAKPVLHQFDCDITLYIVNSCGVVVCNSG